MSRIRLRFLRVAAGILSRSVRIACARAAPHLHAEQDFFGVDVSRDPRIAEGTDQDGIKVAAEHRKAIRRHRDAVGKIPRGAPVELLDFDARA